MRIVCALFLFALFGCADRPSAINGVGKINPQYKSLGDYGNGEVTYRVIIIDGCEYMLGIAPGAYNGGVFLTHKGDCKNKLHHQPPAGSP